jgi:dihydroxy-acid dehydratase
MGRIKEEMDRPMVAVVNSQNELVPGHVHLDDIATAAREGVISAEGTPFEFSTIAICDGLTIGHGGMCYPLSSRELIADSIEAMIEANCMDAMVLVTGCDKITPGMMMAAARLDIPAIIINGGPMLARSFGDDRPGALLFELTGCGSCPGLYTANSMACMAEALGLALPGNSCIPAVYGRRRGLARKSGVALMELYRKAIIPRQILTREAFENAITVDMAIGGSTNTILHLMALANEAGVDIGLDLFDRISRTTPRLCNFSPIGPYFINDLYEAGGLVAVMKELSRKDLLHLDALTASGQTIGEIIEDAESTREEVIRNIDDPYDQEGGLAILYGNLAQEGEVVKQAAVRPEMLKHEGPARVFDIEEEAVEAINTGRINKGDVLVIRYEGPRGGPGFREMLVATLSVVGARLEGDVALITDGRFSGASSGAAIGHISPEAMEGGPLAVIEEGDIIEIDIPERKLNVKLPQEEIEARLTRWAPPPLKRKVKSYLKRYSSLVTSASTGAILKRP